MTATQKLRSLVASGELTTPRARNLVSWCERIEAAKSVSTQPEVTAYLQKCAEAAEEGCRLALEDYGV